MSSTKEKAKQMLKKLEEKWTRHGKREMDATHQMEQGSLHLIGQVVTPHQTKKIRGMRDWYSNCYIIHQFQKKIALKIID